MSNITVVMRQDAILFEDTLRNNITMYQDVPDEKVISILSKVGLDSYANHDSLDMLILEGVLILREEKKEGLLLLGLVYIHKIV